MINNDAASYVANGLAWVQKHSFQRKIRGMRGLSAALLWPTAACSDSLMWCMFSWEQQHVPAANLKILRGSDACRLGGRTTWKIYRMCAAFFCCCKDLVNVQIQCFFHQNRTKGGILNYISMATVSLTHPECNPPYQQTSIRFLLISGFTF